MYSLPYFPDGSHRLAPLLLLVNKRLLLIIGKMRDVKYELHYIILGYEQAGQPDKLKKVQTFLRANAGTGIAIEKKTVLQK